MEASGTAQVGSPNLHIPEHNYNRNTFSRISSGKSSPPTAICILCFTRVPTSTLRINPTDPTLFDNFIFITISTSLIFRTSTINGNEQHDCRQQQQPRLTPQKIVLHHAPSLYMAYARFDDMTPRYHVRRPTHRHKTITIVKMTVKLTGIIQYSPHSSPQTD